MELTKKIINESVVGLAATHKASHMEDMKDNLFGCTDEETDNFTYAVDLILKHGGRELKELQEIRRQMKQETNSDRIAEHKKRLNILVGWYKEELNNILITKS